MAAPRSSSMPFRLKSLLETVEKLFAEGKLREAKNFAGMAVYSFGSYPEAQRAHLAMEIHLAAANNKDDHYGILNKAPANKTHNGATAPTMEVKTTQHQKLCELLDPAKSNTSTESAAAAAALEIVNQALAALTNIKKSAVPATAPPLPYRSPLLPAVKPKLGPPKARSNGRVPAFVQEPEPEELVEAASVQEEEEDEYHGGTRTGRRSRRGRR